MTEDSTSEVGRAAIDAYLDSVEQALLAAHAPRSDRVQVLADLEAQIADMLAREPQPLTEETVRMVIARLEPPSHFAAMYGNGKPAPPREMTWLERAMAYVPRTIRWSRVAAICFVSPLVGLFFEWALHFGPRGSGAILALSTIFGLIATPWALAMAFKQVRTRPQEFPERNLVLNMSIGFAILGPAFLMIVFTEWTHGLVLVPLGIASFVYLQYWAVRRLHSYMDERLPPAERSGYASDTRTPEAPPAVGGAMTMPAV